MRGLKFFFFSAVAGATMGLVAQPVEQLLMPQALPTYAAPGGKGAVPAPLAFKTLSSDTLSLPFADDFSRSGTWRWADRKVQVGSTWAIEARSVGQAVFDGLDTYGRPYKAGSLGSDSLTDVLTSPFLDLRTRANVVLTFLYQAGGTGDPTETDDSLLVDFWNPADSSWLRVWSRAGGLPVDQWRWASVPVPAPWATKNGFRFRVGARGARGGAFDHWLVDHVFVGANRTAADTVLEDPAWTKPHPSLLNDYSEVPYWLPIAPMIDQEYALEYRRNGPVPVGGWSLNLGKHVIERGVDTVHKRLVVPVISNLVHNSNQAYGLNVQPYSTDFTEPYTLQSTVWFDGENVGILSNDTLRHLQRFENRYGWDDGTSERAYGVQNIFGAKVAMYTPLYRANDTLRGVDLAFVPAGVDATQQGFRICVWEANNTLPGNLIYRSDSVYTPDYSWGPDVLVHYILDTVGLALPNTVFLGWEQDGIAPMHVGFDVNSTPLVPNVYGEPGIWYTSLFQGRLRMRPFFNALPLDLGQPEKSVEPALGQVVAYPNPGANVLHVRVSQEEAAAPTGVEVLNLQGIRLYDGPYGRAIEVSDWPAGMYTVRVHFPQGVRSTRWMHLPE